MLDHVFHVLWEALDFTSVQPHFFSKCKERYKTNAGSFMGSLCFLGILALSIYFAYSYLSSSVVNIIYYEDSNFKAPFFDLNDKPFFFQMKNGTTPQVISNRILNVIPVQIVQRNSSIKLIFMATEPCNIDKQIINPELQKEIPLDFSQYTCIVPGKYDLNVTSSSEQFTGYVIYFQECRNSSSNNNSCESPEVIQKALKTTSITFNLFLYSSRIDHFSQNTPIKGGYYTHSEKLSYDFYYRYYDYFKLVTYTSDDGSVFEDLRTTESIIYDDKKSTFKVFSKGIAVTVPSFGSVELIINTQKRDCHKRFYPKLQSVLANIGGIISSFMLVAKFIGQYISTQQMMVEYASTLVSFSVKRQTANESIKLTETNIKILPPTNVSPPNMHVRTYYRNKMTLLEALLPARCLRGNSAKKVLAMCAKVFKLSLGIENLIKIRLDLEKLKCALLDENRKELLKKYEKPDLDEYIYVLSNSQDFWNLEKTNETKNNFILNNK